ncbi:MAG: hypothetical protein AABY18_04495 [Candidatus Thermoplasmatota archaeon]
MSEAGGKRGLKMYLATLVATVLFPILWMQALSMARRHGEADPRARLKVLVAIAASLGIALAGTYVLLGFFASAQAGMYDSLDTRIATAVGEAEYQEQLSIIEASNNALPKIRANLANATDDAKRDALQATLESTTADLAKAEARRAELVPVHTHYGRIAAAIVDQDDAEVRRLLGEVPAFSEVSGSKFPAHADIAENSEAAFAIKDRSVSDMRLMGWLFLWPSLAGAFFAPLAFALGSILRKAFVPSDTVGFKPYPGGAAGYFLLLGAFGVPSIPFAAWTFNDAMGRSEEGQISL